MLARKPKTRAIERSASARLLTLRQDLLDARDGVPIHKLAERYKISRKTVGRMLDKLEAGDPPLMLERNRQGVRVLDRDRVLIPFQMDLHQAMNVFLAARFLAEFSSSPSEDTVKALNQLGHALRIYAPRIAGYISATSDHLQKSRLEEGQNSAEARHLRMLTTAWAQGLRVRLWQRDKPEVERLFEPYFIEVNPVGYLSYVIGNDVSRGALRTFTIERLRDVVLTNDTYSIPKDFDPFALLADAWGVDYGDRKNLTEVRLRFAAGTAANRVRETRWHASQKIVPLPDGACEFTVRLGSTKDMLWWIRQWGASVEVLAPPALRAEVADEMRRAAEVYERA